MYTSPFRLSGVTVVPFNDIFPARNSTKYLLEDPREPGTRLGNRAPEVVILARAETRPRSAVRTRSSSSAPAGPRRKPRSPRPTRRSRRRLGAVTHRSAAGRGATGECGRPSPAAPAPAPAALFRRKRRPARGPERPLLLLCHRGAAAAPGGGTGNGGPGGGRWAPDSAGQRAGPGRAGPGGDTCGARGRVPQVPCQCGTPGPET